MPRIVALGASAGGLHALSQFFRAASAIPGDVAFVIVVHLAPGSESHLPELLAKDTPLPVSAIEDGARLRAGQLYVIPPKVSVVIEQDRFRLRAAVELRPSTVPLSRRQQSGAHRTLGEESRGTRSLSLSLYRRAPIDESCLSTGRIIENMMAPMAGHLPPRDFLRVSDYQNLERSMAP
ncbi:chemotaxis protein CheB [Paraburkholderia fungorum]|uniref:chemotaxis protein CheB n=1 Tax=Paraburkholderia fungorum TaxID=134537 RepID=UPI0038B876AF